MDRTARTRPAVVLLPLQQLQQLRQQRQQRLSPPLLPPRTRQEAGVLKEVAAGALRSRAVRGRCETAPVAAAAGPVPAAVLDDSIRNGLKGAPKTENPPIGM